MSRVYFTDRDLGKRFPEILTAAGLTNCQVRKLLEVLKSDACDFHIGRSPALKLKGVSLTRPLDGMTLPLFIASHSRVRHAARFS